MKSCDPSRLLNPGKVRMYVSYLGATLPGAQDCSIKQIFSVRMRIVVAVQSTGINRTYLMFSITSLSQDIMPAILQVMVASAQELGILSRSGVVNDSPPCQAKNAMSRCRAHAY